MEFDRNKWKIISSDHITLSETIRRIRNLENDWRLPTPDELESLPEEATYMNGLNISDQTFYWTDNTNLVDDGLQMVAQPCHSGNHPYFRAERKRAFAPREEIYAVATCQ